MVPNFLLHFRCGEPGGIVVEHQAVNQEVLGKAVLVNTQEVVALS